MGLIDLCQAASTLGLDPLVQVICRKIRSATTASSIKELQEQEYARLIDSANAPIFGIDRNGHVNVWNRCASRLMGYSGEDVMGHNLVQEFISAEYRALVQNVFDNALSGVETANFEFPLHTKLGARVQILLNATTRRGEDGRTVLGVVGIGQDITARIAQEQEYARLIDTANAPIFGIDVNGNVNVWNRCASALTGYAGQDVMGKHLVNDFITPEYKQSVQNVFETALQGTETANFEFPLITKTGARVEILLNATTRRDEHDVIVGVVGIGQDITARIAQEQEYARLIDAANAPIFGIDVHGHVNVWNQCASNLTGFAGDEVMGNHLVSTFITVEYRTSVQDVLEKAMRGVETANFEFPLMNKDGTRLINILLNATTRRDAMGGVVGVVGIGQDISEARAKQDAVLRQKEAEAAQAAQATISAHVYHEIRNVVGAVLALADRVSEAVELALEEALIAVDDPPELVTKKSASLRQQLPKQVRQLTEHQRIVCQHAVNTLNDMLDVAKIENGMYTPKEDIVDLGDLCGRAAKLQGPRLRPGVELIVDAPPVGSLVVLTDSVLLLQFLTNLLSNAAKFTGAGNVMVHCHVLSQPARGDGVALNKPAHADDDDYVDLVLAVADTGPGIAMAQQQRVLLAFTTGDAVPHEDLRDASRSTGIGLRLADLIANVLCSSVPQQPDGFRSSIVGHGASVIGIEGAAPDVNLSGEKRWWRKQRRGIQLESPVSAEIRAKLSPAGGPGTLLWLVARMKRAPKAAVGRAPSLPSMSGGFTLKLRGKMRVLVVDDQRTMRQMVATIFQRLCQDSADLRVELHTALSGEQAIRMAKAKRYHIITMDEQLSESYCRAVAKEHADREAKGDLGDVALDSDGCPDPLVFGPNRIENAQKRLAFFDNEINFQSPVDGDGILPGHEAISVIREHEKACGRAPTIIFNLTGNVLEGDRSKYTESGSNGVLPKPTKLADLQNLLSLGVPKLVQEKYCDRRGGGIFMDGDFQLGEITDEPA